METQVIIDEIAGLLGENISKHEEKQKATQPIIVGLTDLGNYSAKQDKRQAIMDKITDLLKENISQQEETQMEKQPIIVSQHEENRAVNWLELSDSQRNEVLAQARAFLQQRVEEEKYSRYVEKVLQKHGLIE